MDSSKKYMYFNASTGNTNGAVMCPVSGFMGMQTTNSSNLILQFVEAYETDTLDLTLTRVASSDPRIVMEAIVHAINFSKDSVINVADDFEKKYIDSNITDITGLSDGFIFPVLINRPTTFLVSESSAGKAEDAGDGFSTNGYGHNTGSVGQINGEVITTLFIDLQGRQCPDTAEDVIGLDQATDPAYITKITTLKNGIIYRGELICVEVPTGTGITARIDLVAFDDGTKTSGDLIDIDAEADAELIVDKNESWKLGEIREFQQSGVSDAYPLNTIPSGGIQDDYLYLAAGATVAGGEYTAGKFILRLYGVPTANLNDIA